MDIPICNPNSQLILVYINSFKKSSSLPKNLPSEEVVKNRSSENWTMLESVW